MTVGERIKLEREKLGLSQTDLAIKMGYSTKSAVSRSENSGDDIGINRIQKFAEALNVSPSYLMGWKTSEDIDRELIEAVKINKLQLELKELSEEEYQLVKDYRNSDDTTKEMIKRILRG